MEAYFTFRLWAEAILIGVAVLFVAWLGTVAWLVVSTDSMRIDDPRRVRRVKVAMWLLPRMFLR